MRRKQVQANVFKSRKFADKGLLAKRTVHRSSSFQQNKESGSGYTLYSESEVEENKSEKARHKKCFRSSSSDTIIKTENEVVTQIQVQASMNAARCELKTGKMILPFETFNCLGVSTPFNKRLISSTPVPEHLIQIQDSAFVDSKIDGSLQMIPEKDTGAEKFPNVCSSLTLNLCDQITFQRQSNEHKLALRIQNLSDQNLKAMIINSDGIPLSPIQSSSSPVFVSKAEWTDETSEMNENKKTSKNSEDFHTPPLTSEISLSPEEVLFLSTSSSFKEPVFKHSAENSAFNVISDSNIQARTTLNEDVYKPPAQIRKIDVKVKENKTSSSKMKTKKFLEISKKKSQSFLKDDDISAQTNLNGLNTSADTCDLEVSNVNDVLNKRKVHLPKNRDLDLKVLPAKESSNVSQIIELLKANSLNETKEKQYKKLLETDHVNSLSKETNDIEVHRSSEMIHDIMNQYISKIDSKDEDSINSHDKTIEGSTCQNSEQLIQDSICNKNNDTNQNYNSDSENEATSSRHPDQPKNLHYLESMSDPTLRNIACRLSFKATALRDLELRDLIDDMIYFTDVTLGKEYSKNQSSYLILREENFNLIKQVEKLNNQLEVLEIQEMQHLAKELNFILEEKEKLDIQVTSLLEERSKWLTSQQDLVKTISLKDHEILKLTEKHHEEKKLLHKSLEQVTKNTQGVHKKLSGADRQIEKLHQRLKCKDLDIEDLQEKLKDTEKKLKHCEANSVKKVKEMMRLQDLVDSLKLGVDHVLQAFEMSHSSTSSSAQKQGIENLKMIIHPDQYRTSELDSSSKITNHRSTHVDTSSQYPGLKVLKKSKTHNKMSEPTRGAQTQSTSQYENKRHEFKPESYLGGFTTLTSQALETHNQRLSPLNKNLWRTSDGRGREETHFSDTEMDINHDSRVPERVNTARYIGNDTPGGNTSVHRQRRKSENDKYERYKNASIQTSTKSKVTNSEDDLFTVPIVQSLEEINYDDRQQMKEDRPQGQSMHGHQTEPDMSRRQSMDRSSHINSFGPDHPPVRSETLARSHDRESLSDLFSTLRSRTISDIRHDSIHTGVLSGHRNNLDNVFTSTDRGQLSDRYKHKDHRLMYPADLSYKDLDRNPRSLTSAEKPDPQTSHRSYLQHSRQQYLPDYTGVQNHLPDYTGMQNCTDYVSVCDCCQLFPCQRLQREGARRTLNNEHQLTVHFESNSSLRRPDCSEDSQFYNGRSTLNTQSSPLHTSDTSVSRRATRGYDSPLQREFFQGTELSGSISSIDDADSVVRAFNNNGLNVEDEFMTGIASLDEKIANLQKKINRTKAIFTK
ncbi:hypothetical protein Btru_054944 [Bulinus truncatus]|nr:hypothetical protein Btru_054944 [Bulinus truncatus]